jgi:hypothetical protein
MSPEQLKLVDEALLKHPANLPAPKNSKDHGIRLLMMISLMVLTLNSAMAVYLSRGDSGAIFFVSFSYVDLVSLLYCLHWYERAPPKSPCRKHLKIAVWLLTTMLTIAFSYKVAAIMPFPVQVLVWGMAGTTVLSGFYCFFLLLEETKA